MLRRLLDLELPDGEWALFGSGPLLARRWIEDVGDLDVIARGRAWDVAQTLGRPLHLDEHDVDVVAIEGGITIGARWAIGSFDVDELIDTAEFVDEVPCVRLEHVAAYKEIARRPKDLRHLEIIAAHLG